MHEVAGVVGVRGGVRAAAGGAVLAALLGGLAGCGSDAGYGAELEKFTGPHAVENEVVDLPGGDRFSAGSPDGHDVVIQRYDGDADGWSDPTTVHTEADLWTHGLTVSHDGSTVVLDVDYWQEEELDDDYAPRMTIGAVCPDTRCTPGVSSGERLGGVALGDDGGFAVFRRGDGRFATWDGGHEWTTQELSPLPEEADVELVPDGSFVAATGSRAGQSCEYTLLTTEPRGFELVERATSSAPYDGDDCEPVLDEVDDDRVSLWLEETSGTVEFVRHGGSWEAEAPPPSYLTVADTGGSSTLAPFFGRSGSDRVVLYSPDLRTLWGQSWSVYTKAWTQPQQVATVPDGAYCRRGRVLDTGRDNGFYAEIDCFDAEEAGLDPSSPPDGTLALRSWNGLVWRGALVRDAGRFADTGLGFLVAGDPAVFVDMDTGETQEVTLPFPAPRTDAIVAGSDGWVLRVGPRETGGRCEATVHSAPSLTAGEWDDVVTLDVPSSAGGCPRLDAALHPDLRVVVRDGHGWQATLRQAADTWRVER